MSIEFVRRTQNLFRINDEIRKATLAKNLRLVRAKLVDGLLESCLLLEDMLKSDELGGAQMDPESWKHFRDLKKQNNLDEFLNLERKFLSSTELEPAAVELIVGALGQVVELMIAQQGRLDSSWRNSLNALSSLVCDKASQEAHDLSRRPLLRRAFLTAGGSIVTMLNLFPPPSLPIPPQVATGSVSLGIWLMGNAAQGVLDEWASAKE